MRDKVRIGLVGTRMFAESLHIPSIKSHNGAILRSICGRDEEIATAAAEKYDIENIYADYREMFASGDLDGVVIASPDDVHYEMVMNALQNGLHIMCEKPLALTVEQAAEMAEVANETGIINMVNFTWRWMPNIRYVYELVESGEVGEPVACHLHFLSGSGKSEVELDGGLPWRRDPKRGHGNLGDLGAHIFDMARLFMGEVESVAAYLSSTTELVAEGNVLTTSNDSASILARFKSGAHGNLSVGCAGGMAGLYLRIIGRTAIVETTLSLSGLFGPERHIVPVIKIKKHSDDNFTPLSIPGHLPDVSSDNMFWDTFQKESCGDRLFIDGVLNGQKTRPDFKDALEVQKIIEAAEVSHQSGKWQAV